MAKLKTFKARHKKTGKWVYNLEYYSKAQARLFNPSLIGFQEIRP